MSVFQLESSDLWEEILDTWDREGTGKRRTNTGVSTVREGAKAPTGNHASQFFVFHYVLYICKCVKVVKIKIENSEVFFKGFGKNIPTEYRRIALAALIMVEMHPYVFKFPFICPAPEVQEILFDILFLALHIHSQSVL